MAEEEQPGAEDDLARFDPWSGHHFGGARFFAASTVIHIGLLLLFATLSFTVMQSIEKINVTIVEPEQVGVDETDGAPSLDDYAGLLNVTKAPTRQAQRPAGPVVHDVQAPRVPTLGGVGPKLGSGPAVDLHSASLALGGGGIGGLGGSFGIFAIWFN